MHYISLEYYARFVDIKISEHSGDTQVSSREDIEEGACRSVESSKLIFFSEIHFYQKFKMHSSRSLILELRTKKINKHLKSLAEENLQLPLQMLAGRNGMSGR